MNRSIEEIENEIRTLSAEDRMHLLRDLIADLDGWMDEGVEKAWLKESVRRYDELKTGKAQAIPAEEVFSRARERIRK